MSSTVGSRGDYFDSHDITFENVSDGLIFQQTISVNPTLEYDVTPKYLSNNTIEKLTSLLNAKFDISMMATQAQFAALAGLANTATGILTRKNWKVTMLSQTITAGNVRSTSTILGQAIITNFKVIDNSIDEVSLEFTLDFETTTDSTAVLTIT